ncbi:MAG: serine protease [Gammaproteobacteria bacterium]|nr:serine protease [Gammaproteobacteria bacterium]
MSDLAPFQRAIVRVTGADGGFHGVGLLLAPDLALTCAHVAADALNYERNMETAPPGELRLNLPFADSPHSVAAEIQPDGWFPGNADKLADLALLRLHEPLAAGGYARLSPAFSLAGLRFEAWGGQEGHEQHLIHLQGRLGREIANGRYILDVQDSNYKIRPGCSGAPAIDPATGLILGLIAQEELDEERQAGFLIPVRQVRDALRLAGFAWQETTEPGLSGLLDWAKSRYRLRFRQQADVLRFIEIYRDKPDDRKPFVGRAAALQHLDNWLAQTEQRLLLLSGAAGRGKSALILHWLAKITATDSHTLFFLPVSIRFNTSDEMSGVRLLHAALCDAFGELKENLPQQPQTEDFLDRIYEAWEYIANRPQKTFLLVIDGMDEAVNQWFTERRILPPHLPPNLHILVSARHKPGQDNGRSWLEDLGFSTQEPHAKACPEPAEGTQTTRSETLTALPENILELSTLEQAAMAEAVVQLGHPLDQLAERQAFVEALFRLTDRGDPLLLGLWLGQIWQQRDRAPDFDAEDLQRLAPSFTGFYLLWLKDQQTVWKAQRLNIHPDDFGQIMHLLALAHAPLLLDDLRTVLERLDAPTRWEYRELRAALESAHRLVAGDGKEQGYVLLHPRLADYFREELNKQPVRLRTLHQAFLAWGADTVARLNSGGLPPEECSPYLLQYYVAHVQNGGGIERDTLDRHYLPLLESGWYRAWDALPDGGLENFLNDIRLAQNALTVWNQNCEPNQCSEMNLATEVRCALLVASIHTMNQNIQMELVVEMAWESIWSFARAARVAGQYMKAEKQAECLTKLAAIAPKKDAKPLRQQALQAAEAILDKNDRTKALSAVAAQLLGEEKRTVLQQALQAAAAIPDENDRAKALSAVATQLQGESALLQQALQTAEAILDKNGCAKALSAVAAQLLGEEKRTALQQALQAAAAIPDENDRAKALSAVATQLQGESALLQQALQTAVAIQDKYLRISVLNTVVEQLQGENDLLKQALQTATTIQSEYWRASTLNTVVVQLRGESALLQQALQAAAAIQNEYLRIAALNTVVEQMQGESALLQQALQVAAAIRNEWLRTEALSAVAVQLQGERALLQQALQVAAAIRNEWLRTKALSAVAVQLQGERALLQQALQAATVIQNEKDRAKALSTVAAQLQGESTLLQRFLQAAATIQDKWIRTKALSTVAVQLLGEEKRTVLQQALQTAVIILDKEGHAKALSAVAAQMQGKEKRTVLQQALQAAVAILDEEGRAKTLSAVTAQLHGENALLQQALQTAASIQNKEGRAKALSTVAVQLQGKEKHTVLQQALQAAVAILDEEGRAKALSTVAAQLQGKEKHTVLQQALQAAVVIQAEWRRANVLSAVAAQLQGEEKHTVLQQALQAAVVIQDEWERAHALRTVATQLQRKEKHTVLQQALQAAAAIQDAGNRTKALSAVAAQLPGESALLQQILQAAAAIQNDRSRAEALSVMAAQLQGESELQKICLDMALALPEDQKERFAITAELTRQNPAFLTYDLWNDWLSHAPRKRADLLDCIGDLAQAAVQLTGNPKQAEEIARAVVDVGEWWP